MRIRPGWLQALTRVGYPLLLFILALGLYGYTLAPTITWQHDGYDAGDLIVAAHTLGIPHPTGYPTYMLLGKAFTCLPLGDVAYRMNLMSAVCAALGTVLLYLSARTLLQPLSSASALPLEQRYVSLASWCAAGLFATSRVFWSQAVITEVYALNCLFFALLLYLLLQLPGDLEAQSSGAARCRRAWRVLTLSAFLLGLSLGNHLTTMFTLPLVLFHVWLTARHCGWRPTQWLRVLATVALGLSVYLYLPLRAGRQPLLNWGNPSNWRGFLWLVTGGIYRQYVLALPLVYWPERVLAWAILLRQQFGLWGTALGLFGAWQHARRRPQQFGVLALTFAIYSAYAIGYNTTDSYVYLLPAYFVYALWIAQGAFCLLQMLNGVPGWRRQMVLLLSLVLLALPLASLLTNLPRVDLSEDYTAYDYGIQVLQQVPDGSLVVSATDAHSFTLWYFARVVAGRDQLALLDRDLLGYDWYVAGLRQCYPWLELPGDRAGTVSLEGLLEANAGAHPIFFTDPDAGLMARYELEEQGRLYRLQTAPPSP